MRVVHCKREPYDVYIGRGSIWGNPYTHKPLDETLAIHEVASREEAIMCYEGMVRGDEYLLERLPEIAGMTLGCWCDPNPCHGHVLVKLCRERGLIE